MHSNTKPASRVDGEVNQRIGLVYFPAILKPSSTREAVSLVTQPGQHNPCFEGGVPNVFFTVYPERNAFLHPAAALRRETPLVVAS